MKEIDFNSDDWKEKLKGKSPEEIARIVGSYYEEKYGQETRFWSGRMIGMVVFILIMVFIFIMLYHMLENLSR
ncbi:MAG: hypothetical protein NC905_01615 [Candidatus Omnitrophica bacterium]|nr:hypothetical protein [Candidatus Omnitrophota bacterium]MCM8776950.1 hypothetical protein [Candidatus Omnitrophota bacterium]